MRPCFGWNPVTGRRVGRRHRWYRGLTGSPVTCIWCGQFYSEIKAATK